MKTFTILKFFGILAFGFSTLSSNAEAPPSVAGKALICDMWQLNFETHTWGCLYQPRQVSLARGTTTDEVIKALFDQIQVLEERIKKLEEK